METASTNERYTRGLAQLHAIDGRAGEEVVAALSEISPDFARLLIEFGFGDIYARPTLDRRSKEIAVIAALAAMGTAAPQLKVHLNAALNVGVTRDEVVETMILMGVYAGFPAALNGLFAAKAVFAERDAPAAA